MSPTSTVAAQMGQGAVRIAAAARGVALLLALLLAAPLLPAARFFMTNLSMLNASAAKWRSLLHKLLKLHLDFKAAVTCTASSGKRARR
jgi:hypothetical protein